MTGQGTNNNGLRQQLANGPQETTQRQTPEGKGYLLGYRYTWRVMGAEDFNTCTGKREEGIEIT